MRLCCVVYDIIVYCCVLRRDVFVCCVGLRRRVPCVCVWWHCGDVVVLCVCLGLVSYCVVLCCVVSVGFVWFCTVCVCPVWSRFAVVLSVLRGCIVLYCVA